MHAIESKKAEVANNVQKDIINVKSGINDGFEFNETNKKLLSLHKGLSFQRREIKKQNQKLFDKQAEVADQMLKHCGYIL